MNGQRGSVLIKYSANIITITRIVFAILLICVTPFTFFFWICYIGAGVTDLTDGFVARKLKQQSDFGAKLDSIADLIFAGAMAIVILVHVEIPVLLWIAIAVIAALRFTGYGIGYLKYHTFSSLHTLANKVTGGMVFLFPVLYAFLGIKISGSILCVIAFLSALEELVITIRSQELCRDRKGITK